MRRRAAIWLTVCCVGAVSVQAEPWRFAATGDSRGSGAGTRVINGPILMELALAIAAEKPDLAIFTGDLALGPGTEAKLKAWTNMVSPLYAAGIGVYPVRGNHDIGDGWEKVLGPSIPDNGPPKQTDFTYFVTNKNAIFIALDQYGDANLDWLDRVLATNRPPHVFTYGHMPAFRAAHFDCLDNDVEARDRFWTILKKAGSRVYFCGHDHFYDHARIDDGDGHPDNDLHQLIVGSGGAPTALNSAYDGENRSWKPVNVFHDRQYGYVLGVIDGPRVTLTWKSRASPGMYRKADEWSYTAGPDRTAEKKTGP